jgi:hypothetical protein
MSGSVVVRSSKQVNGNPLSQPGMFAGLQLV